MGQAGYSVENWNTSILRTEFLGEKISALLKKEGLPGGEALLCFCLFGLLLF